MTAVISSLTPISSNNQLQNSFTFCHEEYDNYDCSVENASLNNRHILYRSFSTGDATQGLTGVDNKCFNGGKENITMSPHARHKEDSVAGDNSEEQIFLKSKSNSNEEPVALSESLATRDDHLQNSAEKEKEISDNVSSNESCTEMGDDEKASRSTSLESPTITEDSTAHVNSKRKRRSNRRQRKQNSMDRKWKQLDVEAMGFHLSSFPRMPEVSEEADENGKLPEESDAYEDSDINNMPDFVAEVKTGSMPDYSASRDREYEDVDDETFFANLGIDVNNSGYYDNENDIWQWDGVCAGKSNSKHKSILTNYPTNKVILTKSTTKGLMSDKTPPKTPSPTVKDKHSKDSSHFDDRSRNKFVSNISKSGLGMLFDLGCVSSRKTYLRSDRHRKVMKCHKAVKSKHAKVDDLFHNPNKKRLYMHHRLIKRLNLDADFLYTYRTSRPSPLRKHKGVDQDWVRGIRLKKNKPRGQDYNNAFRTDPQNLNHVLHDTNVPTELETDLLSYLINAQNRDLTPEDYEMLLRLDDSVQAKTVSKNVIDSLKTETVGDEGLQDSLCAICMEPYTAGQVRKFLPCSHDFHCQCIDTWLNNSSQNCPLDGLPIDTSQHS